MKEVLCEANVNPNIRGIEYAVRGVLARRAGQIELELAKGAKKPFNKVIRANIGDCRALGQPPITFVRQVLALASCPELMDSVPFPEDVKQRVQEILADCINSTIGAYSPPAGLRVVRESVARWLHERDGPGVPANADCILLGAGASDLVRSVLALLAGSAGDTQPAVMVPVPQYPLFSGTLAELGLHRAEYFLAENASWSAPVSELRRAHAAASKEHCVRAVVVINPGNPTGQVFSREDMEQIVKFAEQHSLLLIADEVYQENVIDKPFYSFKKVWYELGVRCPLFSVNSCSKGWAAECGLRGGWAELCGAKRDGSGAELCDLMLRPRALQHCPSVLAQCLVYCVTSPPTPGSASYPLFHRELLNCQKLLRERASDARTLLAAIPGYCCNVIDGGMFAFPRVELPAKAREAARAHRLRPDEFYCAALLEHTGIVVVPGSGFGQLPDTFHFRMTILHQAEEFRYMLTAIREFHLRFLDMYT